MLSRSRIKTKWVMLKVKVKSMTTITYTRTLISNYSAEDVCSQTHPGKTFKNCFTTMATEFKKGSVHFYM